MINIFDQLDLRDLYYFQCIATLGHVGKAAAQLHKTQPALTESIRRLERSLNTQLFIKNGRNIKLSPSGELLLLRSHKILNNANDIVKEIKEFDSNEHGQIRLGVVPTAAHHLILPITKILTKNFPDVQLKAVIGQTDVLYEQLEKREIDLVIGLNADLHENFEWIPFYQDTMVVVANSSHKVFQEKVSLNKLSQHKWVLAPPSVMSRQWLDRAFELNGLPKPEVQIETNLLLMIPSVIMQTDLLSFISRRNLSFPDTSGQYLKEVPIKELNMQRQYNVISRKDSYLSLPVKNLKNLLVEQGASIFESQGQAETFL
ncbi:MULTISPECIES: LysR family transcriptional regulator [Marinomonas]|uniref:LysR family transcriptional regulator n=1 Tax=Marinomonas rhodophyticola TaxID=2992803 RepID=A0ABT3KEV3_9GAMM|nr:LysR family transcriptional regulator [Marinomonas sp. KJ51-3]MCW4629062.1 LysR family transcriptional regulator [Marinomonas sp. KJ51-3]